MIVAILAVAVVAAIGVAFYRHKTFTAIVASAKKEIAYLESVAGKVDVAAKADFSAAIARLKALF